MNNHHEAVEKFFRYVQTYAPEKWKEVQEKLKDYTTLTRYGWRSIKQHERTSGLLGTSQGRLPKEVAHKHGIDQAYDDGGE